MFALASFGFGFRRSKIIRNLKKKKKKNSLHTPKPHVGGIPPDYHQMDPNFQNTP